MQHQFRLARDPRLRPGLCAPGGDACEEDDKSMVSIHGSVGGIRVAERHRGNTFGEHFVCKCRISYEERTESSAEMFFSVFLKMWIIVTIEQGAEALGDGKVLRSRHAGRATASVQIGAEPSLGGREHG